MWVQTSKIMGDEKFNGQYGSFKMSKFSRIVPIF